MGYELIDSNDNDCIDTGPFEEMVREAKFQNEDAGYPRYTVQPEGYSETHFSEADTVPLSHFSEADTVPLSPTAQLVADAHAEIVRLDAIAQRLQNRRLSDFKPRRASRLGWRLRDALRRLNGKD